MKKYVAAENQGLWTYHSDWAPYSSANMYMRSVTVMYYISTVEEGGETDYYFQDIKIQPIKGRLVIVPSYFTHMHKGGQPVSSDKTILLKCYTMDLRV